MFFTLFTFIKQVYGAFPCYTRPDDKRLQALRSGVPGTRTIVQIKNVHRQHAQSCGVSSRFSWTRNEISHADWSAAFVPEERRTRGTDLFYLQNVALSPPRMHVYSFSYVTDLKIRVAVRADVISFALLISRARTFFTAGIRDSK